MDNLNLISNFAEFKELKNIDKSTMIGVLEDVFRHALQKQYETDENFDVIINPEKGDLEIWRNRTVVEDGAVEDPNTQIAVSEVKAIDPTYEIGDDYADEIKLQSFGRRAVLSLRQNLASRILDLEKASLYEKYSEKVGDIVTGEVWTYSDTAHPRPASFKRKPAPLKSKPPPLFERRFWHQKYSPLFSLLSKKEDFSR